MKRMVMALLTGIALGSVGLAEASGSGDSWVRNGVICTTTGRGQNRGVVCALLKGRKTVIVNQRMVIVGTRTGHVLYMTTSR